MNRLSHLKLTLDKNLNDNLEYDNLEFVVLNYNSRDEIDEWMYSKMMKHIKCGRLKYVKTTEPEFFRMAHAKNMVTSFSSGDIVCNVDADNYIGKGFAEYVNFEFNKDENIFLGGSQDDSDLSGRICLWRRDFLNIRGYDEMILDYGYEDLDMYRRLSKIGRREVKIINPEYQRTIPHEDVERMINGQYYKEINFALIFRNADFIDAYIFKSNGEYENLSIVDGDNNELVIDAENCRYGEWSMMETSIECIGASGEVNVFSISDDGNDFTLYDNHYRRIQKAEASLYYSVLKGRTVFRNNVQNTTLVNADGFGRGVAQEVFDTAKRVGNKAYIENSEKK